MHLPIKNNEIGYFRFNILPIEKEKYNLSQENKQLRVDRGNFLDQLKELQESITVLKKENSSSEKLLMDAYVQTSTKTSHCSIQTDAIKPPTPIPAPPNAQKSLSEVPSKHKPQKTLGRKPSKKTLKRPPSKLSFSRASSTCQSSPPSISEAESNFSYSGGRDTESLANELILLNREVSALKAQLRKSKWHWIKV